MNTDPDDNLNNRPGAGRDAPPLGGLEMELRALLPLRQHPPAEWRRLILPHLSSTAAATGTTTAPAVVSAAPALFSRPLTIALAACWVLAAGMKLLTPPDPLRTSSSKSIPIPEMPAFPRQGLGDEGDLLTMTQYSNLSKP
jgi:hypothetical protein